MCFFSGIHNLFNPYSADDKKLPMLLSISYGRNRVVKCH